MHFVPAEVDHFISDSPDAHLDALLVDRLISIYFQRRKVFDPPPGLSVILGSLEAEA